MAVEERYVEDDFGDEEREVQVTPAGRGLIVPASARRLKGEAKETFALLMRTGMQLDHLERHLFVELVPTARDLGLSWSLIGAALGITGEGARQRYGGVFGEV